MQSLRHVILDCKLPQPIDKLAEGYAKEFAGTYPPNMNQQQLRVDDIFCALAVQILIHLGSTSAKGPRLLQRGLDVSLDYFFGDWWKTNENPYVDYRSMIDKTAVERDLIWFKPFSMALLLGLLGNRWDEIARLSSWVDASLTPEFLGGDVELETCQLYISIAASLRSEPMPGLEDLEAKICQAKPKRPRLLMSTWKAARAGDQAGFEKSLAEALKHFAKRYTGAGYQVTDWIAQHESVVCLSAMRLGRAFPQLPERLAAMLLTPSSISSE